MKRIIAIIFSLACLCSLRAQEVAMVDSLQVNEPDSVVLQVTQETLYRSWQRQHPWKEPSPELLSLVAEQQERSLELDSLLRCVEAVPYDATQAYAQRDIRLPLSVEAVVPEQEPGFAAYLQSRAEDNGREAFDNPFARQLAYGATLRNAVNRYAMSHLNDIEHLCQDEEDISDFSRRRIDRKEFEATELVISDAALDLGTATLDIEQVTFHADKWHRKGSTSLQISQTALSSNWYKGGDNNMTLSTYDKLAFSRYDESMKTTLDISFELKLSGYYTAADTINPVRVNDNQFRFDVSYGYKAWKSWYYSTSFYLKTPLLDFHAANSKVTKSTFFSPLETNLGIGLDYKKQSTDKRVNFNLMLAPLSYSVTAVCSDRVNEKAYGLKEGETSLHQIGSSVTCKLDWKITDMVSWNTRFYYFTTYEKVQLEFENTVNVQLGKYCSAKFYYYPRLDDSRDDHFECKQMLTFGLSWIW